MATRSAAEMPTLSRLYETNKLAAPPEGAKLRNTISSSMTAPPAPSKSLNDRVSLCRVDITLLELDAIVNAANNSLLGGGGVDGAIHRAAGRNLVLECAKLKGCHTGSAKITDAYELPCKKVIHAVGPIYDPDEPDVNEAMLTGCYTTSLELAVANGCRTVAFSALSTGVYGYPSNEAAPVAITAVRKFLESDKGADIDLVVFVVFERKDLDAYTKALPLYFPPVPEGAEAEKPAAAAAKDEDAAKAQAATKDESTAEAPVIESASKTDVDADAASKTEDAAADADAEKTANVLPEEPTADPADAEHVKKKLKQDH